METILGILLIFASGIYVGAYLEGSRWRSNASAYHRIESGGQLYKVTRIS